MAGEAVTGYKFMPFGMGRRRCNGVGLALRMVALILATFLQCFEWEKVSPEEDMTEGPGLSMPKATPLKALYKPRQSMVPLLSQLYAGKDDSSGYGNHHGCSNLPDEP
ncbi:hypothetical protein ZIOFF_074086 [Zingiber officinale]|uniref:Uncharacterized protein n=1 Tax=Zingiber officinale TaxID=94328 RepID=A0A8J5BZZ9_ZINOF|nr:hypothetical protein ZIOFF_074086 [Zingiber officinale]